MNGLDAVSLSERHLELSNVEAARAVAVVAVVARGKALAVQLQAFRVPAVARVAVPPCDGSLEAETWGNCGHILGLNL